MSDYRSLCPHVFRLQKRAVGQVLLSLVYKHLGLDEQDYFGLLYTDDKNNPVCVYCCVLQCYSVYKDNCILATE